MSRERYRRLRSRILGVLSLPIRLLGRLPWTSTRRFGDALGTILWRFGGGKQRRRMIEHLSIAFPHLDEAEREKLRLACCRHLLRSVFELLYVLARPPETMDEHVEIVGFEEVEKVRASGRPCVVLTAHCGNWELISCANTRHDLGLSAMARQQEDPVLDDLIVGLRAHLGTTTIARGSKSSSRQLLKTLRRRGALALLIDQDFVGDGVWVPFFDRLAHTPRAAADLALRLGAGVVPTFSERLEDGSHRIVFHPALDLPEDPIAATALMTQRIEEQIRRRPEQWVWMHRRWRRRPGEGDQDRVLAQ